MKPDEPKPTRRIIALLDHEPESVTYILGVLGEIKRNRGRKPLTEVFDFVSVIVESGDDLARRAYHAILERCTQLPDLVLVDLAFEKNATSSSVEIGRNLALSLRDRMTPVPVGVYTKHGLGQFQRGQLTSDQLAVVLERVVTRDTDHPGMFGEQWCELLDKIFANAERVSGEVRRKRLESAGSREGNTGGIAGERPDVTAQQILATMGPASWPGLFILGCFDRRITFYSQQVRALTLVRALFESGKLRPGDSVGVIGGGSAGVTAAVAASRNGCNVHLYEARDFILDLQSEGSHRFLHPHIYNWPQKGSENIDARLPILNWHAGYASEVVGKMRDQVERFVRLGQSLKISVGSRISTIRKDGDQDKRLIVAGNEGKTRGQFHAVIVAIGYGVDESNFGDVATPPYWSPDSVSGPHGKEKRRILVSGSGDGGLIDVARATLKKFRHDEILRELTGKELSSIGIEMQRIDNDTREKSSGGGTDNQLFERYKSLSIDPTVIEKIKALKRGDTEVTFNYRGPGLFNLDSSLINRLLALLLIRADVVRLRCGEIDAKRVCRLQDGRVRVEFGEDGVTNDQFDLVIIRHGQPRNYFATQFPEIAANCTEMEGKLAELGLIDSLPPETYDWYIKVLERPYASNQ